MIIQLLKSVGKLLLRNPRISIHVARAGVSAYVTYRGQKYERELNELRNEYERRRSEETKNAAKKMMSQIEDVINNEPDLTSKEKKELKKILKKNSGWVNK